MSNIVDEIFEFAEHSWVDEKDNNFLYTPVGRISESFHIPFKGHPISIEIKRFPQHNTFFITFKHHTTAPISYNPTALITIAHNYKSIFIRQQIPYNGEHIRYITILPDGTLRVETYEGIMATTTPDGIKTTVKPDGTKHILSPNGLLTVLTSEGVTTVLSETASVATIAMLILMIADMRSRKGNKGQTSTPTPKTSEKLDEIKEIAVMMSDGTRPSFKSWSHDPDEVKKFVEMFQSASTAPKPQRVTFTLKNGSKIVIKVDENTADQQKLLDEFIKHLKSL